MHPLLLHMENFGSYREPITVDFTDAEYFALVGPTGAGKSTVIDAICFALYGTVPRWGNETVVSFALAPSATTGRVGLVFESGGRRYAAVRVLTRSGKGVVGTKEARLDELDPTVPIDSAASPGGSVSGRAGSGVGDQGGSEHPETHPVTHRPTGLAEVMDAVVRSIAEGPDGVTREVERLTGLEYRYFTQSVVLPQGKFHDFLHAKPKERQDLLVQLLDAGVYEQIRARAVREEELAKQAATIANNQLDRLADADEAAERDAERRVAALRDLVDELRTRAEAMRGYDDAARTASTDVQHARQGLAALGALAMPQEVPQLTDEIRAADEEAADLREKTRRSETDEHGAEERLAELGDKTALARALDAHRDRERLVAELPEQEDSAQQAAKEVDAIAAAGKEARSALVAAEEHREQVRDAHAAADIASRLTAGEPCPVCLRPMAELPDHAVPADLDEAARAAERARAELDRLQQDYQRAAVRAGQLAQRRTETRARLDELAPRIDAPADRPALEERLAAIDTAGRHVDAARTAARSYRTARQRAERQAAELRGKAEQGWRDLDTARDGVVALGAPPLDRDDLHRAWATLLGWRDEAAATQRQAIATLADRLGEAERTRDGERLALRTQLERADIAVPADAAPDTIEVAAAKEVARAEARLERVRENRVRAVELSAQAKEAENEVRVAHRLALLLKANNFEKWLCSEALELLLTAGSQTLRDLSGGQYELTLSGRGDIEVVDYGEAGMQRSIRTLSGGETFQAALALALALSKQVAGLAAAAARSLDSIFLDEGFGALDPATLDTVAATLQRLAGEGERMVGVVTHVPELAEQVPVRFEVTRDDRGSHLTKVTT